MLLLNVVTREMRLVRSFVISFKVSSLGIATAFSIWLATKVWE